MSINVRSLWRVWALLLVAVLLAWLTLQQRPAPDAAVVAATRQGARLPPLPSLPRPVDPAPVVARLAQSTLWGPVAPRSPSGAAAAEKAPASKWSLTGYYALGETRYVIVSFDQAAMMSLQLKVGDRLPDGSRIEHIEPDRVRVRVRAPHGSAAPGSRWLPVTPGLAARAPKSSR